MDLLERQKNGDIQRILYSGLATFEERCMKKYVNVNMLDHIIDVLKSEEIFVTPFNKLANHIKKEKKKLEKL